VSIRTACLAAEGYVDELADELGAVERRAHRLSGFCWRTAFVDMV